MNIYGNNVILRAIEYDDLKFLLDGINDPNLEEMVVGWSYPLSLHEQKIWYEKLILEKNNFKWIITLQNGERIGMCTLYNIDWKNRVAQTGMKILNKTHRGKGYGFDIQCAIEKFCFEELQLNKLESTILDYNKHSQNLYLNKCEWKVEGVKRQAIFKKNKYHDLLIIGILKNEYIERKEKNEAK